MSLAWSPDRPLQVYNVAAMPNVHGTLKNTAWEWSIAGDKAVLNCDNHILLCRCETRRCCGAKKEGTFYLLPGELIEGERERSIEC